MSEMGQNAKCSYRAYVFRFAPISRHPADALACPFSANTGSRQRSPHQRWLAVSLHNEAERLLRTSHKKGGGPLDQPIGCHCTNRIGRRDVEPIDFSLDQCRLQAQRYCAAEQLARR